MGGLADGNEVVALRPRADLLLDYGTPRAELVRPLAVVAALLTEEQRAAAAPPPPSARAPDRPTAWVVEGLREGLRE